MKLPVQPEKYDRNFEQQRSGIIERAIDSAGTQPTLSVVDGSLPPSVVAGKAFIYVDATDGSLKVVFGSGTTKTLATNP